MKKYIFRTIALLTFFSLLLYSCHVEKNNKNEKVLDNRFTKQTLSSNLTEPYDMGITDIGDVFLIERKGRILKYTSISKSMHQVGQIHVWNKFEDGLMGIALDPNFNKNNFMYLFYSPKDSLPAEFRLSRFTFRGDSVDKSTEKIILKIPTQRGECCHTGGSMAFDKDGNLFLSIGDNTNPFKSDGYAPLDETIGSENRDDQKTTANSNDLRGKILRIKIKEDGTYSIPDGNLFEKNNPLARPEIYVMGNRNPFRITVDKKTGWLFWGEIGPDAGLDSEKGPKGHDEINLAKKPGNFGWPYFIGNNKAYSMYNFETFQLGSKQDPNHPVNNSRNNTGVKNLPPAQKALIWYPYGDSEDFPILGNGGRASMAGPVYHYDDFPETNVKFPAYFDNQFLMYEWIRDKIFNIKLDKKGEIKSFEEHFTKNIKLNHPMCIKFAPDGSLYVLEYGSKWWDKDSTTQLSRIYYERGNRKPIAHFSVSDSIGPKQFHIKFNSSHSSDPDGDKLSYEWRFLGTDAVQSREAQPTFAYLDEGVYYPSLTVKDKKGETATYIKKIIVGNQQPIVNIYSNDNKSFYWDDIPFKYNVVGWDKEDGAAKESQLILNFDYLNTGEDMAIIGHQVEYKDNLKIDHYLINKSDCKSCHQMKDKSVGPSFYDIAIKYKGQKGSEEKLANKIIKGGGGVWGEHAMSAHPQLSIADA